ncbi:MAG: glycosyltransferase family 39 protein, partial [Bryobacteraceae bacterium]|nr:glycosyltransferase family 39 protein [Bryobacteraceae bacterium]
MARYVAAAFIAAYFLAMSWPGLKSGFSHDDLMNLTFTLRDGWAKILTANVLFFSSTYRPLGALFYRGLFDIFGWNGLPFRIVQFAALSFNLYLLYRLTSKLTGWKEAGLIAALLLAWHGNFSPLFFGSGNCYDVLGFLFYLTALNYYVSIRERGIPGFRQLGILAILHICGLNSKEFAVTLPLVLLCYEVLRHPASFRRPAVWPFGEGRAALLCALLSAAYSAGKMFGPDSLTAQSAYKLQFSAVAYLES